MAATILLHEVFERWLDELRDRKAKIRIAERIERLGEGNAGDAKSVGGGISEMRIHFGAGYRLYFIKTNIEIIILLCGGNKATQSKDIRKAKLLAKEWKDIKHDKN